MQLYFTSKPSMAKGRCSIEQMMNSPTDFEICVRNQEEKDLLYAYAIVYGREIDIQIFSSEWVMNHAPNLPIGPTLYTTWDPRVPGVFINGTPSFETHPEPKQAQYVI